MSKEELNVPEFMNREPRIPKDISPLEFYAQARFFNNQKGLNPELFAKYFKLVCSIGEKNCINRQLSQEEVVKMKDSFTSHCIKKGFTNHDLMQEIYSYELYAKEVRTSRPLSNREKFDLRKQLTTTYRYKDTYKSNKPLKDLRGIPTFVAPEKRKYLELANWASISFAKLESEKDGKNLRFIDSSAEQQHLKNVAEKRRSLRLSYSDKFTKQHEFKVSPETKKRIASLVLAGSIAIGGLGIASKEYSYHSTTFDKAVSEGVLPSDLNISDDTLALYNSVLQRIDTFSNSIPSAEEEQALVSDLRTLSHKTFSDRATSAYNKAHKDDKYFTPATSAEFEKIESPNSSTGVEIAYSVKYYSNNGHQIDQAHGADGLLGHISHDPIQNYSDLDDDIEALTSDVQKVNESVKNGTLSEYERISQVKKHLSSIIDLLGRTTDLTAKDFMLEDDLLGTTQHLKANGQNFKKIVKDRDSQAENLNEKNSNSSRGWDR